MIPEKHKNMAENLKNMRKARRLSLAEFSKELDIPKSTLQSVLADGQTSLNTAIRISEKLHISLDTLIGGTLSTEQVWIMDGLLSGVEWFSRLPPEKQKEAGEFICALIQLILENPISTPQGKADGKRIFPPDKRTNPIRSSDVSE